MSERNESYLAIRFFIGLSALLLILLLFCICVPCLSPYIIGEPSSNNGNNCGCIIVKIICYVVTVVALTYVCKFLLDYEAKINHDELSFEKAKMALGKDNTLTKEEHINTVNLNITQKNNQ